MLTTSRTLLDRLKDRHDAQAWQLWLTVYEPWLGANRFQPADIDDLLQNILVVVSRQWDVEHDQQLIRRLLGVVQADFQPQTWEVFRLLVLEDRPAAEVARLCRMQVNAVYVAKARVLARLRQELGGLLET